MILGWYVASNQLTSAVPMIFPILDRRIHLLFPMDSIHRMREDYTSSGTVGVMTKRKSSRVE